jgi:serine/threonine protein kinase
MTITPQSGGRLVGGRYRLTHLLGDGRAGTSAAGGAGTVWAGHDEVLDRDVTVRELVPRRLRQLPPDQRRVVGERLRDARAAVGISHPAALAVYDVVEEDDRPWLVTEQFHGRSLAGVLHAGGPLPAPRVARIGLDLLAALRAAHAAGVVHRDVRPANVMLTDSGAVLTDFGIASLDDDGGWTAAGDLWSLGATLRAAAGESVSGPLRLVIDRLLDKDPLLRPDAGTTRTLLELAASAPSPPQPAPAGHRLPRPVQRGATFAPEDEARQATLVLTAVTVLALLAGLVAVVVQVRGPF